MVTVVFTKDRKEYCCKRRRVLNEGFREGSLVDVLWTDGKAYRARVKKIHGE